MDIKSTLLYKDVELQHGDVTILKNVNFEIKKGEFAFLIGKTGSGKTTLLNSIYGALPIAFGEAVVVDCDLRKLKSKNIPFLRRKMGFVFQDFQLLTDRTVNENLAFVLKATGWKGKIKIEERIKSVLQYVKMEQKGYRKPFELSGGEQQRVAIARALLNDPQLILADEPTGNLDPEIAFSIMDLLQSVTESGTSVIMATHNYGIIDNFRGRVLQCENDSLIELDV